MCEGRRSQVVLLDERRLDLVIQPKLYAGELLDLVASHFHLKEKEYFGIAYYPNEANQFAWLQLDKRVLEHDLPKKCSSTSVYGANAPMLTLYFRVKYYVESIAHLGDSYTVEAFYLQAKSLVAKGELEGDAEAIFRLGALVLQATYGDYVDDLMFASHLRRLAILPASTLKEYSSISQCEEKVLQQYKGLAGQPRGAAVVNYLSVVESFPTYGQHYYEVKDKTNTPFYLGLSYRGISQYEKSDRRNPKRVFLWKQLENLYYRDRKFTIEVHEARRVIHTLSSFNLYEDAIEEPVEEYDDLSDAICDPTTQVSVSRRTLAPANVTVYVWYASSPVVAKCIWSMAIAQHHFFLDRRHRKSQAGVVPNLSKITSELCRSVQSLSSIGSQSNISRSTSTSSLPSTVLGGEISEESKAATIEMLTALRARREALQAALKKKNEELKALCLKEGELTGEIPPELPLQPGEAQPQIRRRVGTSFSLSDKVICKVKNKERETLSDLELEYEIQSKIASAAFQLANDCTARKSVRKQRKASYIRATAKLRNIEQKLWNLQAERKKILEEEEKKQHDSCDKEPSLQNETLDDIDVNLSCTSRESSRSAHSDSNSTVKSVHSASSVPPCSSLPQLTVTSCDSKPATPTLPPERFRQRHQSLQHISISGTASGRTSTLSYEHYSWNHDSHISNREFDSVSCNSGKIHPLRVPYRNRFESGLDIEGSNLYSVPNRRASQVFDSQDDLLLSGRKNDFDQRSPATRIPVSSREYQSPIPLSSSYDEHLWYGKSKNLATISSDCSSVENSFEGLPSRNCETASLNFFEASCRKKFVESPKNQLKLHHFQSENSLNRDEVAYMGNRLESICISKPDLSDVAQMKKITHVQSVPHLHSEISVKVNQEQLHKKNLGSSTNSYSVNQVADLVHASVLLQNGKISTSNPSGYLSPKSKTKEWIETSLDSPLPVRKHKSQPVAEVPLQQATPQENIYANISETHSVLLSPFEHDQHYRGSGHFLNVPNQEGHSSTLSSPLQIPNHTSATASSQHLECYTHAKEPLVEPWSGVENTSYNMHNFPLENCQDSTFRELPNQMPAEHCCHHDINQNFSPSMYNDYCNRGYLLNGNIPYTNSHGEPFIQSPTYSEPCPVHPNSYPETSCLVEPLSVHSCQHISNETSDFCSPADNSNAPVYENVSLHRSYDAEDSFIRSHQREPVHSFQTSTTAGAFHDQCHNSQDTNTSSTYYSPSCQYSEIGMVSPPREVTISPLPPCDTANFPFPPTVEVNVVTVGQFQPYWEETKPYELSDFYKYSTKHRKPQHMSDIEDSPVQSSHHCTVLTDFDTSETQWHSGENDAHITNLSDARTDEHFYKNSSSILPASFVSRPLCDNREILVNAQIAVVDHGDCSDFENHCTDHNGSIKVKTLNLSGEENSSFGDIVPSSLADAFQKEMLAWYDNREPIKKATLV